MTEIWLLFTSRNCESARRGVQHKVGGGVHFAYSQHEDIAINGPPPGSLPHILSPWFLVILAKFMKKAKNQLETSSHLSFNYFPFLLFPIFSSFLLSLLPFQLSPNRISLFSFHLLWRT